MAKIRATIIGSLDPKRFPWIKDGRTPDAKELYAAMLSTASLMAGQATQTERRNRARRLQEGSVVALLKDLGYDEKRRRDINTLGDAPRKGEFRRECKVDGKKADITVGLADGRFMAIECKVSNSEVNSFKRLNHETVEKVKHWNAAFGRNGVVGAVVLSGVFKVDNVLDAQNEGVAIFWSHDLSSLGEYLSRIVEK